MRHQLRRVIVLGCAFIASVAAAQDNAPTYSDLKKILSKRCQTCHSESPSQLEFSETGAPNGVKFDTSEEVKLFAPKIWIKAIQEKSMPPGNITEITDSERETIAAWIKSGASIN